MIKMKRIDNAVEVSIIIVNYFSCELVKQVVDSIYRNTFDITFEIIVVDNSVSEEEFSKLSLINGVKCVRSHQNGGFGYGNNLARKFSSGRYLLFLNADTILLNNVVLLLYDFMLNHSNVGIVGPNIVDASKKPSFSYLFEEKTLTSDTRNFFFDTIIKRFILRNKYYYNHTGRPLSIKGYVCGACLMIETKTFDLLNGFDERIFMYAEECLLCHRVKNELRLDIYNVPNAQLIHLEGGTIGSISPYKASTIVDGNFMYYKVIFGFAKALKYLKRMCKKTNNIAKICFFLRKKEKYKTYLAMHEAYFKKIELLRMD